MRDAAQSQDRRDLPVARHPAIAETGAGSALPQSLRDRYEPSLGWDLSGVRVHADARAASLARRFRARAFTLGRDIVFGAGQYDPGTSVGRRLLAHELVHVVQQGRDGFFAVQPYPEARRCDRTGGTVQQEAIHAAHDRATEIVSGTLELMRRYMADPTSDPDVAEALFGGFFIRGEGHWDRFFSVYEMLRRVFGWLNVDTRYRYVCDYPGDFGPLTECDEAGGVHAWTTRDGVSDIHLCRDYFSLTLDSQAVKIVHEITHWLGTWHDYEVRRTLATTEDVMSYEIFLRSLIGSGAIERAVTGSEELSGADVDVP